jgi:ribonuclease P protein component
MALTSRAKRSLRSCSLTKKDILAVIIGFPDPRSPLRFSSSHETHLPSFKDPTFPHPWLSCAHEKPRRPRCDRSSPRKGAQAFGRLIAKTRCCWPAAPHPMARPARRAVICRAPSSRGNWRSLKSSEFAAALAAPAMAKTFHFVLHHLAAASSVAKQQDGDAVATYLSTTDAPNATHSVDNIKCKDHWWLGLVVPKRHAPRSVTRNLLKRQMRLQVLGHGHRLPPGRWVIRLRASFDKGQFASAASARLREAARSELEQIFTVAWIE